MNAALYKEILEGNLLQSAQQLSLHRGFMFQQDNDLKHTAKIIKKWFQDNIVTLLEWLTQSADLNPIENLWAELKKRVRVRRPQNLDELEAYCLQEWGNIPQPPRGLRPGGSRPQSHRRGRWSGGGEAPSRCKRKSKNMLKKPTNHFFSSPGRVFRHFLREV